MSVGKPHIKRQRNVGTLNPHIFVPRRGSRRKHLTYSACCNRFYFIGKTIISAEIKQ